MTRQVHIDQKYIDYWQARAAKQVAQYKAWEKEAWVDAQTAASILRKQFGATNIIVFGSLVKDKFGEDSDIDMAVEGIAPSEFFAALSAINWQSKWEIDLKPLEALEPHFKQRVLETGVAIDEKE